MILADLIDQLILKEAEAVRGSKTEVYVHFDGPESFDVGDLLPIQQIVFDTDGDGPNLLLEI